MRVARALVVAWFVLVMCPPAFAQDDEVPPGDDAVATGEGSIGELPSEEGAAGDATSAADAPPVPAKSRAWSFGPYVRFVIVPSFMLGPFLDLAPSVANAGFGATAFHHSEDGPSFEFGLGYTSYAFSGPLRKKGGDPGDTEWVQSSLGLVHLTGSMTWEAKFSEVVGFQYGVGLDLGIVTGDINRTEAFQTASGGYAKCNGFSNPPTNIYCLPPMTVLPPARTDPADKDGEQYNVTEKVVPVFGFPMLPLLALRVTPIPEVVLRVQAAYGIAEFWFGFSAGYAPEL